MIRAKTFMAMIVAIACGAQAAPAFAYRGQKYASEAKIAISQARQIALRAYPGKITDEELEKESGGSGLRYAFDIAGAKGVHEVGVDARTGHLLENSTEGPHPD